MRYNRKSPIHSTLFHKKIVYVYVLFLSHFNTPSIRLYKFIIALILDTVNFFLNFLRLCHREKSVRYGNRAFLKQMQEIYQDCKTEKEYDTDKVNHRFHFTVDGFLAYPLNQAENHFAAVKRRYG